MLKKIALGTLLTGLVAVLIWGAVIRTNAKTGEGADQLGRRGRATEYVATDGDQPGYAAQGTTGRGGRTTEYAATDGAQPGYAAQGTTGRGGRWAQGGAVAQAPGGQGAGVLSSVPQADVQPEEWITVQGTVVSVADDLVEIQTTTDEVIPFEGQPLRFAVGQGFIPKVDDAVAISGFDEDGEFKIGQVTNLSSGVSVTLRDASGRPGWAGGGRRD